MFEHLLAQDQASQVAGGWVDYTPTHDMGLGFQTNERSSWSVLKGKADTSAFHRNSKNGPGTHWGLCCHIIRSVRCVMRL